jgi:cardiolipin synthase A/B
VKIYEYQPALLHAKTVVIAGQWATIGSANLEPRSLALCQELNVVVYDRAVARGLEDAFKADVALATRVEYERWRGRGLQARLFEFLVLPIRDML